MVSTDEIVDAERRVGALPAEYKAFLQVAGRQTDDDNNGMLFWPPENLRETNDVIGDAGYQPIAADGVIIADHMQESWWYMLWTRGPRTGSVSLVLGGHADDPQEPIGGFLQFLSDYLANTLALYPK